VLQQKRFAGFAVRDTLRRKIRAGHDRYSIQERSRRRKAPKFGLDFAAASQSCPPSATSRPIMKRSAAALLLSATLLAACGAVQDTRAQTGDARTLIVSGLGEASAAPDLLTLSIGVETQGQTAAQALTRNNEQMRATIARLTEAGVAERDMQTSNLSVSPRYNYEARREGAPLLVGYVATNMLTVKLRDIAGAGALIDASVQDGATNLGGISFGFAEPEPLRRQAREAAVADARQKAEALARAAGVRLGPILRIQDGQAAPPPMPYMEARAVASDFATPIAAGESTLTAHVTLVYEIR
jgi:uncharacterized protein YggE